MLDPTARARTTQIVLWTFLLLACAEFIARGPVRLAQAGEFNDFISPYTQAKAWLRGVDPYTPETLAVLWPRQAQPFPFKRDLSDGSLVLKRGIPTAYPPTALVLIAPISILPWPVADKLWSILSLFAFTVVVFSLLLVGEYKRDDWRSYLFLTIAIAFAPFHSGLATGNLVIVVVGLCAGAVLSAARQRDSAAGILIGVAACLKPQIGLVFLFYFLLKRRWRIVSCATILIAVSAITAVVRLAASHSPWMAVYLSDSRILFAKGSLGDFTESNRIRYGLVNLQLLTYIFLHDREWADAVALAVGGILVVIWLILMRRRTFKETSLLELGTLLVISLLPMYHRFYDASLLVFPLAWSVRAIIGVLRRFAGTALFLLLLFLAPLGTILQQVQHANWSLPLQDLWWWTHIVMPCQVWAILLLSIVCLSAMRFQPLDHSSA
jgi:hypothetical protein